MSLRYKGAVISATPPTTTGGNSGTAPGAWTLQQQLQAQAAGNWPNQPVWYIEDVFSTYLYTGNGLTAGNTITNNIDLSGKGGMVWIKNRTGAFNNVLTDTARGVSSQLTSNATTQAQNYGAFKTFNSSGFTVYTADATMNDSAYNYASWTFRKQPKFFDVVTWVGNGLSTQTIPHSLGSAPGCIINKSTSLTQNWWVYHRSTGTGNYLVLNTTAAQVGGTIVSATSATDFTVGSTLTSTGQTYVAYLFAHDAGGFGLTGTDNVISCGSYTGNGSTNGPEINLGYEPQYVLIKNASAVGYWFTFDNMRGIATGGTDALLWPNVADAEANSTDNIDLTATGFRIKNSAGSINGNGNTLIYIAIRRGPMKTPTTGTSVFNPYSVASGSPTVYTWTPGFVADSIFGNVPSSGSPFTGTRLTGGSQYMRTSATTAEATFATSWKWDGTTKTMNQNLFGGLSAGCYYWTMGRAPGFMDVVCYTGTGATNNVAHNLTVTPELIIAKRRNTTAQDWCVAVAAPSLGAGYYRTLTLNTTEASATNGNNKATATTFDANVIYNASSSATANVSAQAYVSYLFATCPGVSKVGSYTGTGTTQQINCGFTGGARFVLIKRTDSTGDWYVWDSARGIVAGNDPYLLLNSTASEVTSTDYIDTYSAGFEISSTAPAAINANGGTFIFLAVS